MKSMISGLRKRSPPGVALAADLKHMTAPIWLSHPFSPETPGYRGASTLEVELMSSIAGGDTANSARWVFPNHSGTHIDAPAHFYDGAPTLTDYPPDWWIFDRPCVVDVEAGTEPLLGPDHLRSDIRTGTDLVLLRTGYEAERQTERYWSGNPGLDPELAHWLRARHPSVRAVGMDLISVTGYECRTEGRIAHRAFLDPSAPILPIEDMALAAAPVDLDRVMVVPLRVVSADGGPCTVIGFPGL